MTAQDYLNLLKTRIEKQIIGISRPMRIAATLTDEPLAELTIFTNSNIGSAIVETAAYYTSIADTEFTDMGKPYIIGKFRFKDDLIKVYVDPYLSFVDEYYWIGKEGEYVNPNTATAYRFSVKDVVPDISILY